MTYGSTGVKIPLWERGMAARGRKGNQNRKLRAHISRNKHKTERAKWK